MLISVYLYFNIEIGTLTRSFNLMLEKLNSSKNIEKEHAIELETRIKLRTRGLEKSNEELNRIKAALEQKVEERTYQLKRLNTHLVYAEERERKAIASDLHDSVSQTLAMSISRIKNIRESGSRLNEKNLMEIQKYLELAVRETRSLIYQLSPPILDDFDIDIALGYLVEQINTQRHGNFNYINNIEDSIHLDQVVKVTLYRAVNELIINILKHSGLKSGDIEISRNDKTIIVSVEDNGSGFDVDKIKKPEFYGFGLNSLLERIENFEGKIQVESKPGKGTKIQLTVPVSSSRDNKYGKN